MKNKDLFLWCVFSRVFIGQRKSFHQVQLFRKGEDHIIAWTINDIFWNLKKGKKPSQNVLLWRVDLLLAHLWPLFAGQRLLAVNKHGLRVLTLPSSWLSWGVLLWGKGVKGALERAVGLSDLLQRRGWPSLAPHSIWPCPRTQPTWEPPGECSLPDACPRSWQDTEAWTHSAHGRNLSLKS